MISCLAKWTHRNLSNETFSAKSLCQKNRWTKAHNTSDKWPSIAPCLDLTRFTTISGSYLSCCDLWGEPAAVIYYVTDQRVGVHWLVIAVTLVQSSDALSANCTMSGSRESNRCSAASGFRTLERARDPFVVLPQNSAVTLLAVWSEKLEMDGYNFQLSKMLRSYQTLYTKRSINEMQCVI